jgi:nucleoside-diphosphate-sugar epimerase
VKKIFITGASSYVAKPTINYLKKKNILILNFRKRKKILNRKIKITNIDFSKKFNLNFDFNYLLHFASLTPNTVKKESYYSHNVIGFKNLLLNIKKCKKIFLLSAISIYAKNNKKIINENSNVEKKDPYGKSKYKMEKILMRYCKKNNVKFLILRSPGIYDKNLIAKNFITKLSKSIKDKKKIKIDHLTKKFNNATNPETILKFIKKFLFTTELDNQIYNLCSKSIKLGNIISLIEKKYNTKAKIQKFNSKNYFLISERKIKKTNINLPTIEEIINK